MNPDKCLQTLTYGTNDNNNSQLGSVQVLYKHVMGGWWGQTRNPYFAYVVKGGGGCLVLPSKN